MDSQTVRVEPSDAEAADAQDNLDREAAREADFQQQYAEWLSADPDRGNGRVQVAYLHGEDVSHSFHEALRMSYFYDARYTGGDGPILADHPMNLRTSSGRLVQSRNFGVKLFLDEPNIDAEWLMWIDTDMGWEPNAIHELLASADPVHRPVVGGLCFATYQTGSDGRGGYRYTITPTMYRMGLTADQQGSYCFYGPYPENAVVQVAGTGGAFILIHRSVLERVRAQFGDTWYGELLDPKGDVIGEDLSFCLRVNHLDMPVHVNTGVKTTHHKGWWLSEEDYIRQEAVTAVQEVEPHPEVAKLLPPAIDIPASLISVARNEHDRNGMLKMPQDLQRYEQIIDATKPEVIVETGTHTGASARWLHDRFGADVITVDIAQNVQTRFYDPNIHYVSGSSTHPQVVEFVTSLVAGRRCMVILDSDHSAEHVGAEIEAYTSLVSEGCYLVVEDGVFAYADEGLRLAHFPNGLKGSPMEAIAAYLPWNEAFSRDVAVERLHPVSHHPAGFWLRVASTATTEAAEGTVTFGPGLNEGEAE